MSPCFLATTNKFKLIMVNLTTLHDSPALIFGMKFMSELRPETIVLSNMKLNLSLLASTHYLPVCLCLLDVVCNNLFVVRGAAYLRVQLTCIHEYLR